MGNRSTLRPIIPGDRFGRWTVLKGPITTQRGKEKYLCRCDCGTERTVLERSLRYGGSKSCGCLRREQAEAANTYALLGQTFGDLTVMERSGKRTQMGAYWLCRCSCGGTCEATASELVTGCKTHCGCKTKKNYAFADITGQRFGRLTAQFPTEKRDDKGSVIWHCRCDCGNEVEVCYNSLMYANQVSCGCKKREHDEKLKTYLTHVAGTSVEMLLSEKTPVNNTSGHKGVYRIRGKYVAKIVFQKKQYFLGTYGELEDAAAARKAAEQLLFRDTVDFYARWKEKAEQDPAWASDNPIGIQVTRDAEGKLAVSFTPSL